MSLAGCISVQQGLLLMHSNLLISSRHVLLLTFCAASIQKWTLLRVHFAEISYQHLQNENKENNGKTIDMQLETLLLVIGTFCSRLEI